ncbi:polymorphic toxin-type HINT domain-containing protein [Luteimicrobium album]|uniref:polymorphic toxin-type HINT domain-containing protein n=1 Tax=Luteimicrobium album TaxID=1054550 RepID=UPI0024E0CB6D|nr:polymorphic toxin-type HINT domain-containing protein [Luteimicrobium album]
MGRPVDWSPVGLDVDPTPGDPVLVLSGGREYLDVADAINGAAAAMARLDTGGAISQAVDALVEARDDTIGQIRKAHGRYVAAGDALITYAGVLESVQTDTARALEQAGAAFDEQADAARTRTYYQQLAEVETDPATKNLYLQHADLAGQNAATSLQVVARATGDVAAAVDVRDRAAEDAAGHIHQAVAHDGLDDSWWDNWGAKFVAAIADVADLVSQITGTLAMVVAFIPGIGQALAGALLVIAAVAAITSALANIALAATGKRTWAQAGVAVAGAALSTLGLSTAARAATGISKTALGAGARQGATGLKSLGGGGLKSVGGAKGLGRQPVCKVGFGTCFTAGTLVATPDGDRAIETLQAGDTVYCYDQTTGTQTVETIEETFERTTTTLIHLTIDGHMITTTPEHPFMVTGLGWIQAADLRVGDRLITAADPDVTVDTVGAETADESVAVYNLHVHAHHTYYILAGEAAVLVHNMAAHDLSLAEHEASGSHVIARHVGKSRAYLKSRNLPLSSTFVDLETAKRATSANIETHRDVIKAWLAGKKPKLPFSGPLSRGDGITYVRELDKFVHSDTVVTVLKRDSGAPEGYRLLTSYPHWQGNNGSA